MSQPTQELQRKPAVTRRSAGSCCHCGEPCPDNSFSLEEKSFCCFGCQTVFSLLHENGLAQFYELNSRPGIRIRTGTAAAKWAFLDDPVVQEQLLDYADPARAKVTLHLPAIHCVACVWLIENLFKLHPGVGQSLINFSRREAAITFAPDKIKLSELAALLASIGYEPEFTLATASNLQTPDARSQTQRRKSWLQIGLAGFAFGNIMLLSLPFYFGLDDFNGPWFKALAGWLGLALTLPVVTFSAADFWRAAWFSVRQRALTLEVPLTLGFTAIYATSVFEVIAHRGPGYCDSLCGLIFLLLCGKVFQRKTHERLTFDRDYKGFFPLAVLRKNARGEESVAISRLKTGDRLVLRNGELLPADARLITGEACIDYSFVTGEAEPVTCTVGKHLYAGGRQVGGVIEVETIKPVAQSYLASLWNNDAFRKPCDLDLDSLTNRYSKIFTRLIIGIAVGSAAFWIFTDATKALRAFTSVLIVACPCALALAAPLTHGTGQRLLARLKIFLKNALVIERMAEVDTIVLDKTGTLTCAEGGRGTGVPPVSFCPHGRDARATAGCIGQCAELSAEETAWVASLTRHSTHPNSVRITKALAAAKLPVTHFKETPGCGIEGEIAGHKIEIGSQSWLEKVRQISSLPRGSDAPLPHRQDAYATTSGHVSVAIDGVQRGAFTLESSLRPEVEQLLTRLGDRFELALLSGDNEREAVRFQKIFGERATMRFNQSPADKLNFIRELQQRGRKVMMVGDGLNDAGALKQADVGVAVVEQIGVFSPACDVILDAAELPRLSRVLQFARRASWIVRVGFGISAIYNVLGVSIAAAGLLSPIVCAILMPLSSVTVVVFATGATAWMGRKLRVGRLIVDGSTRRAHQPSTINYQLAAKEAA